jgi:hypothetical protein
MDILGIKNKKILSLKTNPPIKIHFKIILKINLLLYPCPYLFDQRHLCFHCICYFYPQNIINHYLQKKKKNWHESRILKFIRKECVNNMRLPWGVT